MSKKPLNHAMLGETGSRESEAGFEQIVEAVTWSTRR